MPYQKLYNLRLSLLGGSFVRTSDFIGSLDCKLKTVIDLDQFFMGFGSDNS